ncbi:MAG: YbaK/EbsC family protein [Candidatus Diapherotrites archaeon]
MGEQEAEKIQELLREKGIEFRVLEHEPVYTSEQAAKVRGVELKQGVKAMVCKTVEGKIVLGLIPADRKLDFKKMAEVFETKHVSLASPQEVLKATNCEIGSVSPFCGILSAIPTLLDSRVLDNELVEFNIGLHTLSIAMKPQDLQKVIRARTGEIAQ